MRSQVRILYRPYLNMYIRAYFSNAKQIAGYRIIGIIALRAVSAPYCAALCAACPLALSGCPLPA
ncbi:MAG: hypothetical protein ACP5I8_07895 [Phycisphaerae bacterium]